MQIPAHLQEYCPRRRILSQWKDSSAVPLLTDLSSGSSLGKTLVLIKCLKKISTAGSIVFLCLGWMASLQLEIAEFG